MEVYNWIRGQTHPYPGAHGILNGQEITVWSAHVPTGDRAFGKPGELLYTDGLALGVMAWEGVVEVTEVEVGNDQMAGAELVGLEDFQLGDRFKRLRDLHADNGR